jgi:hypothetical protein
MRPGRSWPGAEANETAARRSAPRQSPLQLPCNCPLQLCHRQQVMGATSKLGRDRAGRHLVVVWTGQPGPARGTARPGCRPGWVGSQPAGGHGRQPVASAWQVQPAQGLPVALKFKPPPQHRVARRLARVPSNCPQLAGPVDDDHQVELARSAARERGAELLVQRLGHLLGEGPGEHGEFGMRGGGEGSLGGPVVVPVAGDPSLIEGQQKFGPLLLDQGGHRSGQLFEGDRVQCAVGVACQLNPAHPQLGRSPAKLPGS